MPIFHERIAISKEYVTAVTAKYFLVIYLVTLVSHFPSNVIVIFQDQRTHACLIRIAQKFNLDIHKI